MLPTLSAQFFVSLVVIVVMANVILLATAYLILLERKVAAWTQDRIGPNRTNFSFGLNDIWDKIGLGKIFNPKNFMFGLGQAMADGLKLLVKEDYTPKNVDKVLFLLAPATVIVPALLGWAVIPWGGQWDFPGIALAGHQLVDSGLIQVTVAPISIGVIYILAMGSLAVYGVTLGGYASNNKFAFLGSLRATAQMLSYEIPMGLCVLIMILTFTAMSASGSDAGLMVAAQAGTGITNGLWGIMLHPVLAIIFFTCSLAECNRAPFDLAEAEQELVGGFHTEYASMKWALYFLAEYIHMITGSAFLVLMFFGGWDLVPFIGLLPETAIGWMGIGLVALKTTVFCGKIGLVLFAMMWIRWTLPRFRFDQLMTLAWRALVPITIGIMLVTGILVAFEAPGWMMPAADLVVLAVAAAVAPLLPKGLPLNRRVALAGSRFSPAPVNAG